MADAIEKVGMGMVVAMPQAQLSADAWTRERVDLMKKTVCPQGITDAEFALFVEQCKRSGLDPLLKEAFCVPRRMNIGTRDAPKWITKHEFQPGEAGMLARAERFSDYRGVTAAAVYSADTIEIDAGTGTVSHRFSPVSKRGTLLGAWARLERAGKVPMVVWLDLGAYQQKTATWDRMPATMIEKCARVAVLRKAYPSAFGGLYIDGEPVEREHEEPAAVDVQATPRNSHEARRQLAAAVTLLDSHAAPASAQTVEAQPAEPKPARKMVIEDATKPHPWERIKAAGLAAGMAPDAINNEALRIGKKSKRADLTEADAEAFVAWVEDAPTESTQPTEEAAPF